MNERINELKNMLAEADRDYWKNGASRFTDEEYDAMREEYKKLTGEPESKFGTPEILANGKVRHSRPMLSMQKVYDIEKVVAWARKYANGGAILVMPKYDGIALRKYPDGTIATRGDGKHGENATVVAAAFASNAPIGDGEAVVTLDVFESLKLFGYKNSRNAVAGIVGSLDPEIRKRAAQVELVNYRHIIIEVSGEDKTEFATAAGTPRSMPPKPLKSRNTLIAKNNRGGSNDFQAATKKQQNEKTSDFTRFCKSLVFMDIKWSGLIFLSGNGLYPQKFVDYRKMLTTSHCSEIVSK